ncbi:MAG: CidA/LrgA family protein [Rikenellaceae bacterium]
MKSIALKILRLTGQFAIILAFYGAGILINMLSGGVCPAAITGMVLLFLALLFGVVKERWIADVARLITRYMILFFIPSSVGVVAMLNIVGDNLLAIIACVAITTVIVMVVVGRLQQRLGRRW